MLSFRPVRALFILVTVLISIYFSLPSLIGDHKYLPNTAVNLGLDLKGGVSMTLEVDDVSFHQDKLNSVVSDIVKRLNRIESGVILDSRVSSDEAKIVLKRENHFSSKQIAGDGYINENYDIQAKGATIEIKPKSDFKQKITLDLLEQSMSIIRRRIDESGTREIDMQRQGANKILLQVPGVYDTVQIKQLIGKTAKLTFHIVDGSVTKKDISRGNIPVGVKLMQFMDQEKYKENLIAVRAQVLMSGDSLIDAQPTKNNNGQYVVQFRLNNIGAKVFADITTRYKGYPLAIVMDKKVISAPRINDAIMSGAGVISGDFDVRSANEFALLLRSGALPTQLKISEERVVGPTLGKASIDAGVTAVIVSAILVVGIMLIFYRYWGVIASLALCLNFFMILAVLGILDATLTMPGIAGIALTLGMAVDANILILERMKEEYKAGRSILASIAEGYKMSMGTILDANITTVAAAAILYFFGTAAVRGFAVTLSVGILSSMFTSIVCTKAMTSLIVSRLRLKSLGL